MHPPDYADMSKWPHPNYEDPARKPQTLLIINMILLVAAVAAVMLRCYTRACINKRFGTDDIFIIVAFIVSVALTVNISREYVQGRLDRHIWDVPKDHIAGIGKAAFRANILFILSANSTHISWLCFYYRIEDDSATAWFRRTLHASIASIMALFAIFLGLLVRLCSPPSAIWQYPPPADARCWRVAEITLAGGFVKTAVDLTILILPIPLLLGLKMSKSVRISMLFLFTLGAIVVAAGGVRSYYLWLVYFVSTDFTWYGSSAHFTACIEINLGIICACIPSLRPLVGPIVARIPTIGSKSASSTFAKPLGLGSPARPPRSPVNDVDRIWRLSEDSIEELDSAVPPEL